MAIELSLSVNNLTEFSIYEEASQAIRHQCKLPFVEILWDNYCHLEPDKLVKYLSIFSERIAFHIMWSRFLDRTDDEFTEFLQRLKFHVDEVQPLYVSDHICTFHQGNVYVKSALEFNYENQEEVWRRVERYQNYIGRQVLLENFASMTSEGYKQVEFFQTMLTQTGCGVLFDISNARVAEYNRFTPLTDWIDLLKGIPELRCHVGGYEYNSEFNYYRDSHGDDISVQTLLDIKNVVASLDVKSICYEREHHKISQIMAQDIAKIGSLAGVH